MCQQLGYVLFVKHREKKPAVGGAALLVHTSVQAVPYAWREAEAWDGNSEVVAVQCQAKDGRTIIVASLYVHCGSKDMAGFERVMESIPANAIVAGDFNAVLPGEYAPGMRGVLDYQDSGKRGRILAAFAENTGAWIPPTDKPTRPGPATDVDGRRVFQDGNVLDHFVFGHEICEHLVALGECTTLTETNFPSDHRPLTWTGHLGLEAPPERPPPKPRVRFDRVTPRQKVEFNSRFVSQLAHVLGYRRDWSAKAVEGCLRSASRALPRTGPRKGDAAPPPLYATAAATAMIDEAAKRHGEAATSNITRAAARARREHIAETTTLDLNPSSAWEFIRRYFGFGARTTLRPPLIVSDVDGVKTLQKDAADRARVLGEAYAEVHNNAPDMDVQKELREPLESTAPQTFAPVSRCELQAAISELSSGKSGDFVGIHAEFLKMLDDESLQALLPFIDRLLEKGSVPQHWRSAVVTPVPKRKRDLQLPKSWRPVSITAMLCRLCEVITLHRAMHIMENGTPANPGSQRRGQSQFGFRRGVDTGMLLSGLSMFVRDGWLQQRNGVRMWLPKGEDGKPLEDLRSPYDRMDPKLGNTNRTHATLLVSIDASDAFCRAFTPRAVRKLIAMGAVNEARWIAALLIDRTLTVNDQGVHSEQFRVERGVPQGSILAPLLWALVVDDLLHELETECRTPIPGCVAVPVNFADDLNFAVRGFNPAVCVAMANKLLAIVNRWSRENGIPMAKLQASWLSGRQGNRWATQSTMKVVCGDVVAVAKDAPIKLLGVTFDASFDFNAHVDAVVASCESALRMLGAMRRSVKAEKLALMYRSLVLSRITYACDAWYPFAATSTLDRLRRLHYRGCCIITGCLPSSHTESVIYEAGFRSLDNEVRSIIVATADKLRRCEKTPVACFGPAWVVRLFRDLPMPTAVYPQSMMIKESAVPAHFPAAPPDRRTRDCPLALRVIGAALMHGDAARECKRGYDARATATKLLRPLPRVMPYAPHELRAFDDRVRFVTASPGGLVKLPTPVASWTDAERAPFAAANAARDLLAADAAADGPVYYAYTDGARVEGKSERTIAAIVICRGQDPHAPGAVVSETAFQASPIACSYAAELGAISEALAAIPDDARRVVVVTDSKSSLESLQTTWARRVQQLEQETCRRIYDLAGRRGVAVTLAFVFSHVGGAPGNDYVDELATRACGAATASWEPTCDAARTWQVDSTRRINTRLNAAADAAAGQHEATGGLAYRFRTIPQGVGRGPSKPPPREMSRYSEIAMFRGRLGMMTTVGGALGWIVEECPLCLAPGALKRNGGTLEHVRQCVRTIDPTAPALDPAALWTHPVPATAMLLDITRRAVAAKTARAAAVAAATATCAAPAAATTRARRQPRPARARARA